MCDIQNCIDKFVDLFEEFSCEETDCLSREQFKALVTSEINSPDYEGKLELCDIDDVFAELDRNNDDKLDFQEFINCMGKMIKTQRKKAGRGRNKGRRGKKGKGKGRRGSGSGSCSGSDDECGGRGGKGGGGGRGGKGGGGGGGGGRGGR
ncbi:H/ACA ribonucleoprotein complex subunit 1-like [Syngnathus acus]|uniref:H/ACA ribonucleoprotein complex subunit 1-like n=1 Tax=Syngnathus acus TaxID=161584 RepID=UPI001885D328|nr:H/ACA ribonucleoprotein complex subunit 1-like [Syngnathus acus]